MPVITQVPTPFIDQLGSSSPLFKIAKSFRGLALSSDQHAARVSSRLTNLLRNPVKSAKYLLAKIDTEFSESTSGGKLQAFNEIISADLCSSYLDLLPYEVVAEEALAEENQYMDMLSDGVFGKLLDQVFVEDWVVSLVEDEIAVAGLAVAKSKLPVHIQLKIARSNKNRLDAENSGLNSFDLLNSCKTQLL